MLGCLASTPTAVAAGVVVALNVAATIVAKTAAPQGLPWKIAHTILAFGPADLIKVVQTWRDVEKIL